MAPRFGLDGTNSDFDATLVLATMLISQLNSETNASDQPHSVQVPEENDIRKNCSQSRHGKSAGPSAVAEHLSDHTKIWSDLSGPAARSSENSRERKEPMGRNPNLHTFDFVQGPEITHASSIPPARETEVDILQKLEFEADRLKTKKRKDRQFTEEDHEKAWEELRVAMSTNRLISHADCVPYLAFSFLNVFSTYDPMLLLRYLIINHH
ncbi:hypothetical protein KSP40_PGU019774 [Platanthera guangdongensis]|uniref:Uncharacterized protein n=1 Tax=Platanthera guangdongensis TaxID=2320717 RepID=A0ABR2M6P7_9ASPA